jgi:hypothetical protein
MASGVENCANCGEVIGNLETPFVFKEQVVCRKCHQKISSPVPPPVPVFTAIPPAVPMNYQAPQQQIPTPTYGPQCNLCGGLLVKKVISSGNCSGLLIGLILVIVGLLISLTGIGLILGIPIMILGLFCGGKRRKVLKCAQCGAIVDRA